MKLISISELTIVSGGDNKNCINSVQITGNIGPNPSVQVTGNIGLNNSALIGANASIDSYGNGCIGGSMNVPLGTNGSISAGGQSCNQNGHIQNTAHAGFTWTFN